MTPVEICSAVLAGIVPAASLPELSDEDTRQEVRYRLSQVGCDLVYSRHFESWTARFVRGAPDIDAVDSPDQLNNADLAVLAVCWLHLRFLPAENSRLQINEEVLFPNDDIPEEIPLDVPEITSLIPALSPWTIKIAVGKLKTARFLVQREGRLRAGPLMDTLDEVKATEQARRLILRLQRVERLRGQATESGHAQSPLHANTSATVEAADAAD
jgi:hypothetical protein